VTAGGGTKAYGASDPTLSATTQTGFTAADALTITLSSTRAVGETVGSYATTATASGAAVSNYTITYVAGTFIVTKKAATVTAGGGTKIYGTADPSLSATTQTGFTAADAATITLTSTRAAGETVGSYATTATASGTAVSNYTITYVAGTFTITKAAATVTAGGGTKVVGASDPPLSATTQTGFTTADAATITLASTRAAGETVGSYPTTATATGAALSNYTVTYVAGTFTITAAGGGNHPPVANNDTYTTNQSTALTVAAPGVLLNDTDVDPGDTRTAVLVAAPTHGTLTLNANGAFRYTPSSGFIGTDTFRYQAKDAAGALSNIATVTITVTQFGASLIVPATTTPVNGSRVAVNESHTSNRTTAFTLAAFDALANEADVFSDSRAAVVAEAQSASASSSSRSLQHFRSEPDRDSNPTRAVAFRRS
jgi:VCBS repeat-containing protein